MNQQLYLALFKAGGKGWEKTAGWCLEKNAFSLPHQLSSPYESLVMSVMGTEVLSCVNCVFSTEFNNLFLTWMAFENELILINACPC